jgi:hypothetical protein
LDSGENRPVSESHWRQVKARHQRLFILVDEWLGVALCLYLWKTDDRAFWPVLITWAVLVYAISYPWYWLSYRQRNAEEMSLRREDS